MTKKEIAEVKKLAQKKYRYEQGLFVAEGLKAIREIIDAGFQVEILYATCPNEIPAKKTSIISEVEMERISFLQKPTSYLALIRIPNSTNNYQTEGSQLTIILDDVQDPGNLGTIIRLADWFGIQTIVCSINTADCFNPKVVQATMGAIARVKIIYTNLHKLLKEAKQHNIPIFGTFMSGENIYTAKLPRNGIIVMGNEGSGISKEIEYLITHKITIPSFKAENVESLNVAIATAICCSEFKRRIF
ncbi:RNA methyltransferase [Acetobacteroides hydrogenigenes]|uniref:TrmH family RNA methyltransferase n=1 Tax=Acetobacteroides hydrogenigenes TaxID=979970 RepID=A0A4R2EFE6_9BACT|nr:RNA methyltransferase [Acetobacteroides hydrogenigenes]TCN65702.1 TrmH family RNA methyltransferase [Acetobacteroides hydrogenigenes]